VFVSVALFATLTVIVGCGAPPKLLSQADQAFDRGERIEALAAYKTAMSGEFLTRGEYSHARSRLRDLVAVQATAALAKAPTMPDPADALETLARARREYAGMIKDGPLMADLSAAMRKHAAQVWQRVKAHVAAKRDLEALILALRLANEGDGLQPGQKSELAAIRRRVKATQVKLASESGELAGKRAVHQGLAKWADPKLANPASKQLQRATRSAAKITGVSGSCSDGRAIGNRVSGGGGMFATEVSIAVSRCRPNTTSSTRKQSYTWYDTQTYYAQEPIYKTVYRKTIHRTCRRSIGGGYVEVYDCSSKQAVREVSGYRRVKKSRRVAHKGTRLVTTVTHSYALSGSATIQWRDKRVVVPFSVNKSRRESSSTGRGGSSIPSGHTVGAQRSKALSEAVSKVRRAIQVQTVRQAHAFFSAKSDAATTAGIDAAWLDAQAYLITFGKGDRARFEKLLGIPAGMAVAALRGVTGLGTGDEPPPIRAYRPPPRIKGHLWDMDRRYPGEGMLETGMYFLRYAIGYRSAETLDVPIQGNRDVGAGALNMTFRYMTPELGAGTMFDLGWAGYIGKRTSTAHKYLDGEEEWSLSGGVGVHSAARLGFQSTYLSLHGGVRLDYMWHALGDVHAADWTAPFSAVAAFRFAQRNPVVVEAWYGNLLGTNQSMGVDVMYYLGEGMGVVARWEQTAMNARYGGVIGDDIVSIGDIPIRTLDLALVVLW